MIGEECFKKVEVTIKPTSRDSIELTIEEFRAKVRVEDFRDKLGEEPTFERVY